MVVSYGSGDTHDFYSPHPQVLNQVKEEAEKRVLVCVCREESGICVCARTCVCMCVGEGNGGQRVSCVCVCACMHMCVLVRQEMRGVCVCVCVHAHVCVGETGEESGVCVCVGEGNEGWREGFPETEPQRICLGKKEILWFDFIFQSSQLKVKKDQAIVTKILNL